MKKTILSLIALFIALLFPLNVMADEKEESKEKINVYLFWGNGCGYCEAAKNFFRSIEKEYEDYYELVEYEVWYDEDNKALMNSVAEYFDEEIGGVPYIIIGETTFGGYSEEYNDSIIKAIKEEYENEDYVDVVKNVKADGVTTEKNYDTLIIIGIFVVIIGGFGALVYFSRK